MTAPGHPARRGIRCIVGGSLARWKEVHQTKRVSVSLSKWAGRREREGRKEGLTQWPSFFFAVSCHAGLKALSLSLRSERERERAAQYLG